jgi:hypothetical protein
MQPIAQPVGQTAAWVAQASTGAAALEPASAAVLAGCRLHECGDDNRHVSRVIGVSSCCSPVSALFGHAKPPAAGAAAAKGVCGGKGYP